MKTTLKKPTTIRLDADIKEWAQSFARSVGIDLSTLITISLREVKRRGLIVVKPEISGKKTAFSRDSHEAHLEESEQKARKSPPSDFYNL